LARPRRRTDPLFLEGKVLLLTHEGDLHYPRATAP
jgi:hypothetical protein